MKKILIVDDERDFAKALKIRLKVNGYDVVLASNSLQAFTLTENEKPDLQPAPSGGEPHDSLDLKEDEYGPVRPTLRAVPSAPPDPNSYDVPVTLSRPRR